YRRDRRPPPNVLDVRPIGDQSTSLNILSKSIDRRDPVLGGYFHDPPGVRKEDPGGGHEERADVRVTRHSKRGFDIACISNFKRHQLPPSLPSGGFCRPPT